jgi:hypothetical protein
VKWVITCHGQEDGEIDRWHSVDEMCGGHERAVATECPEWKFQEKRRKTLRLIGGIAGTRGVSPDNPFAGVQDHIAKKLTDWLSLPIGRSIILAGPKKNDVGLGCVVFAASEGLVPAFMTVSKVKTAYTHRVDAPERSLRAIELVEDVDVLFLENIGAEKVSEFWLVTLNDLLSERKMAGRKTLMSTSQSKEKIMSRYKGQAWLDFSVWLDTE